MRKYWFTGKSGMISSYYLVVFLSVSALSAAYAAEDAEKLRAAANLSRNKEYSAQENRILQKIKCDLAGETLESGEYQTGDLTYTVEIDGSEITVWAYSPEEQIVIEILPEAKQIYDYRTVRNETPA